MENAITGYNTHRPEDKQAMLKAIGVASVDALFANVPPAIRLNRPLALPAAIPEWTLERHMEALANKNATVKTHSSFLGGGAYEHYIPAVVDALVSRGEFLTSYTPYQPEISQGLLQALFEYQTALAAITGLPVVNGSCYDGATALADAAWACCLISRSSPSPLVGGSGWGPSGSIANNAPLLTSPLAPLLTSPLQGEKYIIISDGIWPHYRKVIDTYMDGRAVKRHALPLDGATGQIDIKTLDAAFTKNKPAGFLFQSPNALGIIEDVQTIADTCAKHGVVSVCSYNPLLSGIFTPPGVHGIDIVTCDGQPLGLPLNAGGPSLGVFATKKEYRKYIPGRLVGKVTDINGNLAYALVYEDREQHIARERATSNICSNQALNALRAVMYLATVGEQGFAKIAALNAQKAHYLAENLSKIPGVSLAFTGAFFNEFVIALPKPVTLANIFAGLDYSGQYGLKHALLIAVTETKTRADLDAYVDAIQKAVS